MAGKDLQSWVEVVVPQSDGQPYKYGKDGESYDKDSNTSDCDSPDVDFRWRVHLATWLKRQLAPADDSEALSYLPISSRTG